MQYTKQEVQVDLLAAQTKVTRLTNRLAELVGCEWSYHDMSIPVTTVMGWVREQRLVRESLVLKEDEVRVLQEILLECAA